MFWQASAFHLQGTNGFEHGLFAAGARITYPVFSLWSHLRAVQQVLQLCLCRHQQRTSEERRVIIAEDNPHSFVVVDEAGNLGDYGAKWNENNN